MLGELVSMGDEEVLHTVHGHICGRCQDVSTSSLRAAPGSPGRLHSSDQYWEQKKAEGGGDHGQNGRTYQLQLFDDQLTNRHHFFSFGRIDLKALTGCANGLKSVVFPMLGL